MAQNESFDKKKKKYFHKTITMYIKYYPKFLVTQKLICLTETNLYKSRIFFLYDTNLT